MTRVVGYHLSILSAVGSPRGQQVLRSGPVTPRSARYHQKFEVSSRIGEQGRSAPVDASAF